MGASPSTTWGVGAGDAPPSFNEGWTPPAAAPDLGTNLARGKPVTSSALCAAGEVAANAVDGVLMNNSKWCSGASPAWLLVDLGGNQSVGRFVIKHAALGGETTAWNSAGYTIETSTDNVNWTTRVTVSGNRSSRTVDTVSPVMARYVRLNVITPSNDGNAATRIYEFEIYGGP
jgi:hypothetical protein